LASPPGKTPCQPPLREVGAGLVDHCRWARLRVVGVSAAGGWGAALKISEL